MKRQLALKTRAAPEESGQLFQELTKKLGSQNSVENLFLMLTEILCQYFSFSRPFFLGLRTVHGHLRTNQKLLIADPMVEPTILDDISRVLYSYPEEQVDTEVNHLLCIQESNYQFRFFTNGYQPVGALFWVDEGLTVSPISSLLEQIFMVTEQFSVWCCRFRNSQELLYRDDLTNLYNYRYLEICLENEIKRVQRYQTAFSLLFIDLDSFKPINDSYGHLVGSNVLRQLARLLQFELRNVDSIFRYGGDEFVILLLEAEPNKATRVAERLRARIAAHDFAVGPQGTAKLTASIGIACCPTHSMEKEQLLQLADDCMYKSKRSGKNKVAMVASSYV